MKITLLHFGLLTVFWLTSCLGDTGLKINNEEESITSETTETTKYVHKKGRHNTSGKIKTMGVTIRQRKRTKSSKPIKKQQSLTSTKPPKQIKPSKVTKTTKYKTTTDPPSAKDPKVTMSSIENNSLELQHTDKQKCIEFPSKGKKIRQYLKNSDNIKRLVVYFYAVKEENEHEKYYIYIPGIKKQHLIPELPVEITDIFAPADYLSVENIMQDNPLVTNANKRDKKEYVPEKDINYFKNTLPVKCYTHRSPHKNCINDKGTLLDDRKIKPLASYEAYDNEDNNDSESELDTSSYVSDEKDISYETENNVIFNKWFKKQVDNSLFNNNVDKSRLKILVLKSFTRKGYIITKRGLQNRNGKTQNINNYRLVPYMDSVESNDIDTQGRLKSVILISSKPFKVIRTIPLDGSYKGKNNKRYSRNKRYRKFNEYIKNTLSTTVKNDVTTKIGSKEVLNNASDLNSGPDIMNTNYRQLGRKPQLKFEHSNSNLSESTSAENPDQEDMSHIRVLCPDCGLLKTSEESGESDNLDNRILGGNPAIASGRPINNRGRY